MIPRDHFNDTDKYKVCNDGSSGSWFCDGISNSLMMLLTAVLFHVNLCIEVDRLKRCGQGKNSGCCTFERGEVRMQTLVAVSRVAHSNKQSWWRKGSLSEKYGKRLLQRYFALHGRHVSLSRFNLIRIFYFKGS